MEDRQSCLSGQIVCPPEGLDRGIEYPHLHTMRLEPGSRLGPYEIIGPIGAGGMGEVYRARDTRLGREVAIKILPREVSRDPERLARFEREARSASALNHRNIVTIHDFTSGDGETWLVMELIHGDSLRAIGARGPLSLKRLLPIAAGIAEGLAAAHAAGIVHRDLKPENVMLTGDGTPKILDFGLVKRALSNDDASSPTDMQVSRSGAVMGTARYMSPEQARGEAVDFRTDQFSLGLMLHEMASGKHPFGRPMGVETLAAILNEEPESLDESLPEPFAEIVQRCLAKEPARRYGSTSDLAHDLARLRDRSDRQTALRPRRRTRTWPFVVFAAITIAAVAALLALVLGRRRDAGPSNAIQAAIATPEISQVVRDEVAMPVSISPDGRFLVVYGIDADAIPGLWIYDLRSGASRQVAQNTYSAGWSSDSKAIAYFADGKLKTVSVDGGPSRIICNARPEGTPAWHGDNILYVQYSIADRGIYRVNASGGKPEKIVGADTHRVGLPWWPRFLPDGKHYLYLMLLQPIEKGTIDHELRVGSLDGGPPQKVPGAIDSRAEYANGNLLFVRDGTLMAQPFDPDRVRFAGEARPLVEGVHYFRSTGLAAFSVSDNGVLAWRSGLRPSRLAWLDRTGSQLKEIGTARFTADGRLSPDGRRYAVGVVDPKQSVSDIWIYDLDRDSSERVTFSLLDEKAPVWAADGRTIFYRSDGGGGPPDIFRWTPEAEEGQVYYRGPGVEEPQDVSPDGRWLLFVDQRQAAAADINVLPLAPPGPARPLVATPFNEVSPRFSPDGRRVAYQSDLSGRPEIYVRPFEGSAPAIRVSREGGTRPRWGRDGKELFFLAPGGRLMSVPVSNGVAGGAPHMLFQAVEAVDFEPSADPSRFIVQLEERRTDPTVHLLINWPARLRSDTPP